MWEVRVDRTRKVKFPGKTDHWLQHVDSVELEALWIRGMSGKNLNNSESVQFHWDAMFETNPFQRHRGEKRTAFVADLATGDFAWEYEATKDPSP